VWLRIKKFSILAGDCKIWVNRYSIILALVCITLTLKVGAFIDEHVHGPERVRGEEIIWRSKIKTVSRGQYF